MDKINGVPVTDQDVQKWADEAGRGHDVDQRRKRGRRPVGDGPGHVEPARRPGFRAVRRRAGTRRGMRTSRARQGLTPVQFEMIYAAADAA